MYDYTYYGDYDSASLGGFAALGGGIWLVGTAISILIIVSMWKIFKKAGKQGWESIVPIYNVIVMLEISGLPMWYLVLYIIPIVNIYAMFKTYIELAKKFGKGAGFGVLTVFVPIVGFPVLAFSKCNYEGVTNSSNGNVSNNNFNNNIPNNNVMNNVNPVDNTNVQDVNNMVNNINQMNSVNTMNTNVEQVNNNTMNNVNNDVYSFNSMSDIQTANQNTEQTVNNVNQTMEQGMNNMQANTDINGIVSVTPVMPETNNVNTNTNTDTNSGVNNNQNNNINMFQ